jgi:hypothetical protein
MKIKKYSTEKNGASLSKKSLSYAAMTGAFLAVAAQSDAQIIYHDVNPDDTIISPGPSTFGFFPIDFDGDAVVDIVIQHYIEADTITHEAWAGTFSQVSSIGAPISLINRNNRIPGSINTTNNYLYPSVLNQGDLISAADPNLHSFNMAAFKQYMTLNIVTSSHYGHWYGVTGFMGIEFNIGANLHYGWVEMDIDSACTRVIVKGYAYESTTGMGIHAGDIGVGIPHLVSKNDMEMVVANNPSTSSAHSAVLFSSDKSQDYKIEIMNNLGEVLRTQEAKANAGGNHAQLNLNGIAAGNYFVKLTLGDKINYRKLMVAER